MFSYYNFVEMFSYYNFAREMSLGVIVAGGHEVVGIDAGEGDDLIPSHLLDSVSPTLMRPYNSDTNIFRLSDL